MSRTSFWSFIPYNCACLNAHSHSWGFCSGLHQCREWNFSICLQKHNCPLQNLQTSESSLNEIEGILSITSLNLSDDVILSAISESRFESEKWARLRSQPPSWTSASRTVSSQSGRLGRAPWGNENQLMNTIISIVRWYQITWNYVLHCSVWQSSQVFDIVTGVPEFINT